MNETPLDRACAALGSQQALANALGIKSPSISDWRKSRIPAERCVEIEIATNGAVTRAELRPDVFAAPAQEQEARAA